MEGAETVNEHVVHKWFRNFQEGDTRLDYKPTSKGFFVVEDEALLEMVEQQPNTNTCM